MNPLNWIGFGMAAFLISLKTSYQLVLMVKAQYSGKTNGVYCSYPAGGACVWAGPDSAKVRTYELADHINASLRPELVRQSALLEDIRDVLRTRRD